jgi:hypothetical protein
MEVGGDSYDLERGPGRPFPFQMDNAIFAMFFEALMSLFQSFLQAEHWRTPYPHLLGACNVLSSQ